MPVLVFGDSFAFPDCYNENFYVTNMQRDTAFEGRENQALGNLREISFYHLAFILFLFFFSFLQPFLYHPDLPLLFL